MRFSERIRNTFCYKLSKKELFLAVLECFICLSITSVLFYNTMLASVVMLPYFHFYLKKKEREKEAKRIAAANLEFKDGMMAVSSALGAGYSVENAFKAAIRELSGLYGDDAVIVKEFAEITRKVAMNDNVEDAMEELARHLGIEDAVYFAEVMNVMSFGIIIYLRLAAYEFIAPMYGNFMGVMSMTVCLGGYMGARILSDKIIGIKV